MRIRSIVLIAGLAGAGCLPVPRTLPPGLATWAAEKAAVLADCHAAGHRGQDLYRCMGEYATDRGTYACERTRAMITE